LTEYAREHAAQLVEMEQHLDVDTLDAYDRGRLSQEEEQATRFHIVLCSDCRKLLQSYIEFLEDEPGGSRVGLAELMAAWEELQQERSSAGKPSHIPVKK